jgi:hypothetical protein
MRRYRRFHRRSYPRRRYYFPRRRKPDHLRTAWRIVKTAALPVRVALRVPRYLRTAKRLGQIIVGSILPK